MPLCWPVRISERRGGRKSMEQKQKYEKLDIDIIEIDGADVIRTSITTPIHEWDDD